MLDFSSLLPQSSPITTTFHIFSNLPAELRAKIWNHACFPRTVAIRYYPSTDTCLSSSLPPAILHVSHEAREEARRIYTLAFGTRSSPATTYFNPDRDTLYLPRHRAMGYDETLRDFKSFVVDPELLLGCVQSIAIDHVDIQVKRPWESYNKATLVRQFKNLDFLVLVLCQKDAVYRRGWRGDTVFVEPREPVEEVLAFWYDFRKAFVGEERRLEEVCRDGEMEYQRFTLPTVRVRDKLLM